MTPTKKIELLWKDEQIVEYTYIDISSIYLYVEYEGDRYCIPHTSYMMYKVIKDD